MVLVSKNYKYEVCHCRPPIREQGSNLKRFGQQKLIKSCQQIPLQSFLLSFVTSGREVERIHYAAAYLHYAVSYNAPSYLHCRTRKYLKIPQSTQNYPVSYNTQSNLHCRLHYPLCNIMRCPKTHNPICIALPRSTSKYLKVPRIIRCPITHNPICIAACLFAQPLALSSLHYNAVSHNAQSYLHCRTKKYLK